MSSFPPKPSGTFPENDKPSVARVPDTEPSAGHASSSESTETGDRAFASADWQALCLAALLEVDERVLSETISVAEVAIFRRLKTIFYSAEHRSERAAMEQVWDALQERKHQHQVRLADGSSRAA